MEVNMAVSKKLKTSHTKSYLEGVRSLKARDLGTLQQPVPKLTPFLLPASGLLSPQPQRHFEKVQVPGPIERSLTKTKSMREFFYETC